MFYHIEDDTDDDRVQAGAVMLAMWTFGFILFMVGITGLFNLLGKLGWV